MDQTGDAQEVLLGGREVLLASGETVFIRPWGVRTGGRMAGRIKTMLKIAAGAMQGNLDLGGLISHSWDGVVGIVADTLGVKQEELLDERHYLLEDFFALADAIITVNFIERPGFVKNLLRLLETSEKAFVPQEAMPQSEAAKSDTPEPTPRPSSS